MIIQKQSDILTPDLLLEIQRTVIKDTVYPEDVGNFRERNDMRVVDTSTSTVLHTPPDYNEIEEYIVNLCEFANTDDDEKFIRPNLSSSSDIIFIYEEETDEGVFLMKMDSHFHRLSLISCILVFY